MNKILLIIKREYLIRVRKRSFIIMTILGPVLMAALFIIPAWLASRQEEKRIINVVDETGLFAQKFESNGQYEFKIMQTSIESAKESLKRTEDYAILYIPKTQLNVPSNATIFASNQPSMQLQGYIKGVMNRELEKQKLAAEIQNQLKRTNPDYDAASDTLTIALLSEAILKNIKTNVEITTIKVDETGAEKKSFTSVSMIVGYVGGFMIYMFIFMFGTQVMRGVIEEKTNRIVEVIVSSVKPFQLMMGKIIGIALVGLTQFVMWIVLTAAIVTSAKAAFPEMQQTTPVQVEMVKDAGNNAAAQAMEAISTINFPLMILAFVFYFLFGYLMYAALFASIGSAVDNETDTQQFMMPITIPLILAIVTVPTIVMNPQGSLAFWLSIIPFTSPVAMMVRLPFSVHWFDLALSAVLLIATFLAATWFSGKIYRVGILMYGKKISYAELWKWFKYKN